MAGQVESYDEQLNPLDNIEELLTDNNWVYNRMNEAELLVQVAGKGCSYRILFLWQEGMGALQFCCQYDMKIDRKNLSIAGAALMDMNESLWIGHFEINRETLSPSFRHTCLLRGAPGNSIYDHMDDLVEISLAQCERYQPVFNILSMDHKADTQILSLAMMETAGES